MLRPPLTTVAFSHYQVGTEAAQLLIERLAGTGPVKVLYLAGGRTRGGRRRRQRRAAAPMTTSSLSIVVTTTRWHAGPRLKSAWPSSLPRAVMIGWADCAAVP
jgi:hypothetical protein